MQTHPAVGFGRVSLPRIAAAALVTMVFCTQVVSAQAAPAVPQQVAALKANLATSQAALRSYEWIETTTVLLDGVQKSSRQERVYYGADGVQQKVLVEASAPAAAKRGLRGRIIADKTADLTDYMQAAVALVKSYVPPDPLKVQAAKDAGKVSIAVLVPGKSVRIDLRDFQKAGDLLGVTVALPANRVSGIGVATYLDSPANPVTMQATMAQLPDGTSYAASTTLTAPAKKLTVTVVNSGYRKSS